MIVKLLTEHHLEFLSLKKAAEARPNLHLSKCRTVGNLMPQLNLRRAICCLFLRELIAKLERALRSA